MSSDINFVTFILMTSDINFVTFMMSSDSNFETSMMSIDINFVAFMMISDFCLFDIPVDLVSPGMLQYAVGCRTYLFSVVGSFRVNVLADAESVFFVVGFVTSGKMATAGVQTN